MLEGNTPPRSKPLSLLYGQLTAHMHEEGFEYAANGSINVHITLKPEVLQEYPEEYFRIPAAAEYIRYNPNWKVGLTSSRNFFYYYYYFCSLHDG